MPQAEQVTRVINREIEDVFSVVADPQHFALWLGASAIEGDIDATVKIGSTYRLVFERLLSRPAIPLTITQYDAPTLLTLQAGRKQSLVELTFQLEAVDDGTEVTLSYHSPRSIPFVRLTTHRALNQCLADLQTQLDALTVTAPAS